ncbi:MAG: mismatch-specific DNA-glycosylase [Acidobacteriota bacterium]
MTGPLRPLRDRIRPGVRVLFVGINPGLRSAATGHHFAGYSNRFWRLLYEAGLVPEPITFEDDDRLPEWGYGITNIVPRPTASIDGLAPEEYARGARRLLAKVDRFRPAVVALVGVTVWRALARALELPGGRGERVRLGFQRPRIHGARVCVLPNPSGRNANFTDDEMRRAFRRLRRAAVG